MVLDLLVTLSLHSSSLDFIEVHLLSAQVSFIKEAGSTRSSSSSSSYKRTSLMNTLGVTVMTYLFFSLLGLHGQVGHELLG